MMHMHHDVNINGRGHSGTNSVSVWHWANGSSSAAAVQICLSNTTTKGDEYLAEICDASHLEPLESSDDAADAGRLYLMRRALLALSSSSWLAKSGWEPVVGRPLLGNYCLELLPVELVCRTTMKDISTEGSNKVNAER